MYIFSTAIKNIRRYAGRYLLFGMLIFAVLAVGTISLVARVNLSDEFEARMNQFGGTVTITKNGRMPEPEDYAPFLAMEEVDAVRHMRYYFDIYQNAIVIDGRACDVEALAADEAKWTKIRKARLQSVMQTELNIGQRGKKLNGPELRVIGIDPTCDADVNAETMAKHLVAGSRFPEADNEVALNYSYLELAGFTDVELGSTLTLTLGDYSRDYTVVGFVGKIEQMDVYFYHLRSSDGSDNSIERIINETHCPIILTFDEAERYHTSGILEEYYRIYCTDRYNSNGHPDARKVTVSSFTHCSYDSQVQLSSYRLYDSFMARMEEEYPAYTVKLVYREGNRLVEIYGEASEVLRLYVAAVVAIASAVVLIMAALAMHERRYEIGVLLAVGMGKGRIAALFALENLIFTTAVAAPAYGVGLLAAPTAAAKLLTEIATVSPASAAGPVAVLMLVLAAGLSLPASLISSLTILRFKPNAILRSRT